MIPIHKRISPIEAMWAGKAAFKSIFYWIMREYFNDYSDEVVRDRIYSIAQKQEKRRKLKK
jgi:hypothetical protein